MTRLWSKYEPVTAPSAVAADDRSRSRSTQKEFRPMPRRRERIAVGVGLVVLGLCSNVLIYASLNNRVEVIQIVKSVSPGEQLEADDIRTVEADFDSTVKSMPVTAVPSLIGQYALTLLVPGMIMVPELVQDEPIVKPGTKRMAFSAEADRVPYRTTVDSQVDLILHEANGKGARVSARIVSIGGRRTGSPTGEGSTITVEIAAANADLVAKATSVRIVLDPPTTAAAAGATTTDTATTEPPAEATTVPIGLRR